MAQKYEVIIEGKTPYMQHRMDDLALENWEKQRGRIIERDDVAKEDQVKAEYRLFRNSEGKCYLPAEHIRGALINAGSMVKAKVGNSKKSMKNIVAGMFMLEPAEIILPETWVVDKRSAVNQNVKARIISVRPKWEKWSAQFILTVDNDTITQETIKQILEYSGDYIGIGSFRPQKKRNVRTIPNQNLQKNYNYCIVVRSMVP